MDKTIFKKLPKQVKIKNRTYQIHLVKSPQGKPGEELDGVIWYDDRIEVRNSLSRRQIESTIIHEILHGLGHHFKITLPERTVRSLEVAIHRVFEKNGWKISIT